MSRERSEVTTPRRGRDVVGRVGGLFAVVAAALSTACASQSAPPQGTADTLELRVLDVGQGDAILIRHAGTTVLVDAGETDRIAAQLQALGVDTIDLAVASHNHDDHIGGMDAVLRTFLVRAYVDNGHPATTRIQRTVLTLLHERGVAYHEASALADSALALGDATLRVIPSPVTGRNVGANDRSVALLLTRGGFHAFLTGDSERRELAALLREADIPDVDVLKAAHHGSRTGVLPAWLGRTRPEVIVVSVGAGNSYDLPDEDAMAAYGAEGRTVLRTDRDGDIVVSVDARGCYRVRGTRERSIPRAQGGPSACASTPAKETIP